MATSYKLANHPPLIGVHDVSCAELFLLEVLASLLSLYELLFEYVSTCLRGFLHLDAFSHLPLA